MQAHSFEILQTPEHLNLDESPQEFTGDPPDSFLSEVLILIRQLALTITFFFACNVFAAFETGDFFGWDTSRLVDKYSGQVVNAGAREGKFCARFELRENDFTHNGYRAEVGEDFFAPADSHYLYTFSIYIPADIALTADNRCVLAQWHDQDMDHGKPSVVHSPPLSVSLTLNELEIKHCLSDAKGRCHKNQLYRGPVTFGAWHDFVFDIKWSRDSEGAIEGWMDGKKIVSYAGPVANQKYPDPNDNLGAYMKFGIYCAKGPVKPLVIYHDNYQRRDVAAPHPL